MLALNPRTGRESGILHAVHGPIDDYRQCETKQVEKSKTSYNEDLEMEIYPRLVENWSIALLVNIPDMNMLLNMMPSATVILVQQYARRLA